MKRYFCIFLAVGSISGCSMTPEQEEAWMNAAKAFSDGMNESTRQIQQSMQHQAAQPAYFPQVNGYRGTSCSTIGNQIYCDSYGSGGYRSSNCYMVGNQLQCDSY